MFLFGAAIYILLVSFVKMGYYIGFLLLAKKWISNAENNLNVPTLDYEGIQARGCRICESYTYIAALLHSEFDKLSWLATLPHTEARAFKQRAQQEIKKRRNVFSCSSQIFIKLTICAGYNGRKKINEKWSSQDVCLHEVQTWGGEL